MKTDTAEHRDVLTQAEAEGRAAAVSNCAYTLRIDITSKAPTYRGDVTIRFDRRGAGALFLDFRGKTIDRIEVNGTAIASPDWTGYRLTLPAASLRAANVVHVVYENEYDHGGDGFHQFVDPLDGEEYLYTNFEPYEAHRLFPSFDQPDIKATYELTVAAPAAWEVIANSSLVTARPLADSRTERVFARTKPFSTYLFAIVAGPYHAFRAEHEGVPLGLFCRKSMVEYFDAAEVFEITRQGLDFYAGFFAYPYPFDKYDQVFVPEFNAGAMENVGAVTHNEFMVFRDPPTENQRRRRAEVILHEMAHMWFGDLVTMRWWNDLWLNESFATYMAYLSMTEATRFKSGWQDFNASIKNWAYRQDQLVTTHPIAAQVADTDETFLNFDGITYGKGASVIKQLVAAIGMDGFREGMRLYFRTHEWGNTTLAQFLEALETGSGLELSEWSRLWLETPSLNTISAAWDEDGGRMAKLSLHQSAPAQYPTLRPHQLDVALVRDDGKRLAISVLSARLEDASANVAGVEGLPRPDLVFPNHNDHAYAKVALDPQSVAFVRRSIDRVDDRLLRQMLWSSLWNMTRDAQLKSTEYLALVREKLAIEPSVELTDSVLAQAALALSRFVPEEWCDEQAHLLYRGAWDALQAATTTDARIVWARTLFGVARTPEDLAHACRLADGAITVEGLTVDQEMRWTIAMSCAGYGAPGAQARVAAEIARDPSDRGQRAKLRSDVSEPSAAVKAAAWERFLGEGYGSLHLTGAAMSGFNWATQRDLLEPYVERFFERVPVVFEEREREFSTDYFQALFPAYRVERSLLDRSQRLLGGAGEGSPVLARMLREANDDLERAIRCREFAKG